MPCKYWTRPAYQNFNNFNIWKFWFQNLKLYPALKLVPTAMDRCTHAGNIAKWHRGPTSATPRTTHVKWATCSFSRPSEIIRSGHQRTRGFQRRGKKEGKSDVSIKACDMLGQQNLKLMGMQLEPTHKIDPYLLVNHPNRPFVSSVLTSLHDGFWPWANTQPDTYPITKDYFKPHQFDHIATFLCDQRNEEIRVRSGQLDLLQACMPCQST